MAKRYRVPAFMAVMIGMVEVLFGLYNLYCNCNNVVKNEQFKQNADKVVAECTMAGDDTNSSYSYRKIRVSYLYNEKYENIVTDRYGQCILPGDKVELYVNKDNPTQCVIEYKPTEGLGETYTLFFVGGVGIGLIMIIIGIKRIRRAGIW